MYTRVACFLEIAKIRRWRVFFLYFIIPSDGCALFKHTRGPKLFLANVILIVRTLLAWRRDFRVEVKRIRIC